MLTALIIDLLDYGVQEAVIYSSGQKNEIVPEYLTYQLTLTDIKLDVLLERFKVFVQHELIGVVTLHKTL